jgi:hypothetical protein
VLAAVERGILFDNSSDEGFEIVGAVAGRADLLASSKPWVSDALMKYQALMSNADESFE